MTTDVAWLDTGDGRLAYHDAGTGDPVILLHGGLLDHRMWDEQIPVLESRYRVVAPDARGHGASANASRPFRHADDIAAFALFAAGPRRTLDDLDPGVVRRIREMARRTLTCPTVVIPSLEGE